MPKAYRRYPVVVAPSSGGTWTLWAATQSGTVVSSTMLETRIDGKRAAITRAATLANERRNPGVIDYSGDKDFKRFIPNDYWWEAKSWTGHLRAPVVVNWSTTHDRWQVWTGKSKKQETLDVKNRAREVGKRIASEEDRPGVVVTDKTSEYVEFIPNDAFWEGAYRFQGGTWEPNAGFGF